MVSGYLRRWLWLGLVLLLTTLSFADEIDDLIIKLKDMDPGVRAAAAASLAYNSDTSTRALAPLLEAVRTDPDPTVQETAVSALGLLAERAQQPGPVVEALRGLLALEAPRLALAAAVALESVKDSSSQAARMALYKKHLAPEDEARSLALQGLSRNPSSESFVVLEKTLEAVPLQTEVASALYDKSGTAGAKAVAARIARGLETGQGEDFDAALSLVQTLPSKQDVLLPVVEKLAQNTADPATRLDLLLTLYRWEPTPVRLAPLAELLSAPEGVPLETLSKIVGYVSYDDAKNLRGPLLKAFATSKDPEALALLMDSLASPATDEKEVLALMLAQKASSSPVIRAKIAKNVSSLGPSSGAAVPALKELMKDPELEVALLAATSYYKLTADRAPTLAVFRRAAATEEGVMAMYNHYDSDLGPLGDELLEMLLPHVKAGNTTAQTMVVALFDKARPERLETLLSLYPSMDASARSSYIYLLYSTHIARPQVYDFLLQQVETAPLDEGLMAAQILQQKAGDTEPMVRLLRKMLTSGTADQKLMALSSVAYDRELSGKLAPELKALLPTLTEERARTLALQGLYYSGSEKELAMNAMAQEVRAGRYTELSNYAFDPDVVAGISKQLKTEDIAPLGAYLAEYRKNTRRWDDELSKALLACALLKSMGATDPSTAATLRWLGENHPSEMLRVTANEAIGDVNAP